MHKFHRSGLVAVFLGLCFTLPIPGLGLQAADHRETDRRPVGEIMTVSGPQPAVTPFHMLAHEHVLVDFIGAAKVDPRRYNPDKVLAAARPALDRAHARGVRVLFECTPAYLGRDPLLLRRLSELTGVQIVTNTGLYGAVKDKFLPPYAFSETADQLAGRWITEWNEGIEGTGIRPGFIKCGVDAAPEMSAMHCKLVEAAAIAHRATGLTIAIHTGSGPGLSQLDILRAHGVAPAAFVWIHAQNAPDNVLMRAADLGAWLSFDGLQPATLQRHLALCQLFRQRGQLGQILISHDAGWYDPAKPDGGPFRDYELLFTAFLPLLQANGFTADEVLQLLQNNPAHAFAVRLRLIADPERGHASPLTLDR